MWWNMDFPIRSSIQVPTRALKETGLTKNWKSKDKKVQIQSNDDLFLRYRRRYPRQLIHQGQRVNERNYLQLSKTFCLGPELRKKGVLILHQDNAPVLQSAVEEAILGEKQHSCASWPNLSTRSGTGTAWLRSIPENQVCLTGSSFSVTRRGKLTTGGAHEQLFGKEAAAFLWWIQTLESSYRTVQKSGGSFDGKNVVRGWFFK